MARFVQSGQVRLVSSVTERACSGSIQSEVPVYPRWPYDVGEKYCPDCEGDEGVSQPSVLELPAGADSRLLNREIVSGRRMGWPPCSNTCAKLAMLCALANRPACPATPPRTLAFSSWTSPWIKRWRKVRSSAVGGIKRWSSGAGLNVV